MKVGWIGLGRIGLPMALRVLERGHRLTGHVRSSGTKPDIERLGGWVAASVRDTVADAAVVCVNVYDEDQLRDVLLDQGGLAAMPSGGILVVHSTVSPAVFTSLAAARPDVALLDAAFSGTALEAENGTIVLMVGGSETALDQARPVLSAYAGHIALMGPLGAGMTMKLVNNILFGAQMLLARDALAALADAGIGRTEAVDMLARSSGGSYALNRFSDALEPAALIEQIRPYMAKDVAAARVAAQESGFDLGLLDSVTASLTDRVPT